MRGLPDRWGADVVEHGRSYLADALAPAPARRMTRAVRVAAPPPLLFRWVCQVSVAPYSYDSIDNRGRRSPRELTPGADDIAVGQRLHGIFEVVEVRPGSQLTVRGLPEAARLFGALAITWAVEPSAGATRLLARVSTSTPTRRERLRAAPLAWGDLVMMRKQLITLKLLAERDALRGVAG